MSRKNATSTSCTAQFVMIRRCILAGLTHTDTLKFLQMDHLKPTCYKVNISHFVSIVGANESIMESIYG